MQKILRFVDSLGLSTTAFNISDRVNAHDDTRMSPHLSEVAQTIQVRVPSYRSIA